MNDRQSCGRGFPPPGTGFTLVEVVTSLGIVVFVLVGLIGLLAVGLGSERDSTASVFAANIATRIASELRGTGEVKSLSFNTIDVTDGWIPGTTAQPTAVGPVFLDRWGNVVPRAEAKFRCTGVFTLPAQADLQVATFSALFTWPAEADPLQAAGSIEVVTLIPLSQ
ncbi:MAG: hypothetical protein SNJ84_00765 [Verrucomicrobiia bacterium]